MKRKEWPRIVAHADLDSFYASAEQLDNPDLLGKPMVVGPRSNRGVVLTASYEARKFGVKSAMPMREALRRCPHLLTVPPRFDRYLELSESMMTAFADFSPAVEAISLDEAFLDMSGATGIFGSPLDMAKQIKAAVYEATGGLTVSVGVASTKYVAKVASAYDKPDGMTIVQPPDAIGWLDPMPVASLWGAGPKTVPRLENCGLYTIGDVRRADPVWLRRQIGSVAAHFQLLANAKDPRPVKRHRRARSMGSDRTLLHDISKAEDIEKHLRQSAERIGTRLRAKKLLAAGVRVRLKTNQFEMLSRQAQLPAPTNSSDDLFQASRQLLCKFASGKKYRLVGMAAFELMHEADPVQPDLFAENSPTRSLERTLDAVNTKFGKGSVGRASQLQNSMTLASVTPNLDFVPTDNDED